MDCCIPWSGHANPPQRKNIHFLSEALASFQERRGNVLSAVSRKASFRLKPACESLDKTSHKQAHHKGDWGRKYLVNNIGHYQKYEYYKPVRLYPCKDLCLLPRKQAHQNLAPVKWRYGDEIKERQPDIYDNARVYHHGYR